VLAGLGFYGLVIQMLSVEHPFLMPGMFKDRNFLTGSVLMFLFGLFMFATLALIPPMLQNLMGYPVLTTGLVTSPRGVGTMVGMFLSGRILGRVDAG
jgi:DHA2 family multidrug resistance protein